ncbi:hypothetical protein [Acetobacter syzygii]|uniref:hypothetical protein n=1 Tax=Acetobacter syzygii TaxID=146476 RepID=UPI00156F6B77|nr:hypothetical protein [Acetobacter syzygii]
MIAFGIFNQPYARFVALRDQISSLSSTIDKRLQHATRLLPELPKFGSHGWQHRMTRPSFGRLVCRIRKCRLKQHLPSPESLLEMGSSLFHGCVW